MKTFEEKWTAWLDGELSGRELAEFRGFVAGPGRRGSGKAERAQARRTSARSNCGSRDGQRGIFQSSTARADRERAMRRSGRTEPARRPRFVDDRPVAFGSGATSLAILCVCAFFVMREQEADRSIAISDANFELRGSIRREPERDDLDVSRRRKTR